MAVNDVDIVVVRSRYDTASVLGTVTYGLHNDVVALQDATQSVALSGRDETLQLRVQGQMV